MTSQHKTTISRALVALLRPLIRLCLRHEVTNAELAELVRLTYVEVAYDRYSIPGVEMTLSRAAVLTGMSRKEIARLRELAANNDALAVQRPNKAQQVVHGWLNDAEFTDSNNLPLTLPIKNKKDGTEYCSFVALVKRHGGDVTFGAILDELNHIGVTEQPDENTVALVNYAYIPHKDDLDQVRVVATSVSDLFDTGIHNIECESVDKRFQRQVVYSHIDESLVEELQTIAAGKGQELLEFLNHSMAKAKSKSATMKNRSLKRIGFGMYYFERQTDSSNSDSSKTNTTKTKGDGTIEDV